MLLFNAIYNKDAFAKTINLYNILVPVFRKTQMEKEIFRNCNQFIIR